MRHGPCVAVHILCILVARPLANGGEYGQVELLRDRWGTPHVFAATDAGAMYGLGFATAEDRGFQMHYTLRIIQGRLAELIGPVKKVRRDETAVDNDRKMRTFGFDRAAKRVAVNLDRPTLELLRAYSDGVNDWFAKNDGKLHGLYRKVGLVPEPWTPADCIASWWHLGQFFATDGTRDLIHWRNVTQGTPQGGRMPPGRGGRGGAGRGSRRPQPTGLERLPPDDRTAVVKRHDVTEAWLRRAVQFLRQHGHEVPDPTTDGENAAAGPKFSHAWVAGGKATGTGAAVLVSEPQTPVANPSLFYEFHVSGRTFNARGIGVAGSPAILIGFNRHVAWGLTALGADQADLFRLKTDADHPDQYLFDGRWRRMELIREPILVKGGRPSSLVVRQTHLGPVVNEFAFARPGDPPVALWRIPVCQTDGETIQGALAMMRATDAQEFYKALELWRFPSANVVFGDRQGNIGFSLIGSLVLRSASAAAGGGAAHDGWSSRHGWRAIIPQDLLPHVINPRQGFLFSANHRPIGAFYPIPLGISTGSLGDTVRSWRLRELLEAEESLTPQYLMQVRDDAVNPARREIVRIGLHLRDVLKRELSPEAELALKQLQQWHQQGASSNLTSPGAPLAMELSTFFRFVRTDLAYVYGGGESGLSFFLKTVGRRLGEDPKADVRPLEQEFVDRALADAWVSAKSKYGPEPGQWSTQARRQVTARRLAYFQSLDGFPSLDPDRDLGYPALECVDGGTIRSQAARSYSQWVPLDEVDAAMSVLPIGPSERADDPMRTVSYESWADGQLHPAPLSRAAVERYVSGRVSLSQ